jgi:hypothetical protein
MNEDEPEEESPRPAVVGDAGKKGADDEGAASKPVSVAKSKKRKRAAAAGASRRKAELAEPPDDEAASKDEDQDALSSAAGDDDEGDEAPSALPRLDVPAFALSFPSDPALDELVSAFEQGDYARVRREAPALAKRSERPEVRRAARELEKRLNPDPLSVYLLVAASLLLVFLSVWYWTHPHEAP